MREPVGRVGLHGARRGEVMVRRLMMMMMAEFRKTGMVIALR